MWLFFTRKIMQVLTNHAIAALWQLHLVVPLLPIFTNKFSPTVPCMRSILLASDLANFWASNPRKRSHFKGGVFWWSFLSLLCSSMHNSILVNLWKQKVSNYFTYIANVIYLLIQKYYPPLESNLEIF